MLPVSVTIIAQNEADRIGDTILSVRDWVDEVIVVDSGSTDETLRVAESLGAKVFVRKWEGYGQQKRYAEDQTRNDWQFNLDADERVSDALREEIIAAFQNAQTMADAYAVPIKDRFHLTGKISHYTPFYPVRLYRKSVGRYRNDPVFDRVELPDSAQKAALSAPLIHDSIRSFQHKLLKMDAYTEKQVRAFTGKRRPPSRWRIVTEFPFNFLKGYFIRGYCLDGFMGFIYSVNYAYSRFYRLVRLYEAAHLKKDT